jgi:large subunit ribosomal protein L3
MFKSIIGKKLGMIRIFDSIGEAISVTVINAGPCVVTNICTLSKNGYNAVQLGFDNKVKQSQINKAQYCYFKKNNVTPQRILKEFRINSNNVNITDFNLGQEIKVDIFNINDRVNIRTCSKGKGYAGVIKRHNFSMQAVTHGQSDRTRARGSSGGQGPQKVLKGMKMSGHLGAKYVTIRGLRIIKIDSTYNVLFVKGSVPGNINSTLTISS